MQIPAQAVDTRRTVTSIAMRRPPHGFPFLSWFDDAGLFFAVETQGRDLQTFGFLERKQQTPYGLNLSILVDCSLMQVRSTTNSAELTGIYPRQNRSYSLPGPLLDSFPRPAVAAGPIGALWAGFSFGVVNTLFVRTPNDSVSNDNRFDLVRLDKCDEFFSDVFIRSYIGIL
jgi:hypothetical protein